MDTYTTLKSIADERVDVYAENDKFNRLLDEYHKGNTKVRNDLWVISYRAACNFCKRRFGHYWFFDQINDLVLDILSVLFTRIDNRKKWPDGYKVLNLPSTIENIFLTVYYNKKARNIRENELSLDMLLEEYGDSMINI